MWTRSRLWLASLVKRRQFDRDLADELTFHVQARAEHLRREGVPSGEAARRARLDFGSFESYKDQARDVRAGLWIEQLRQDLRYGARILLGRPGFTAAATLTLALGIGATATVFALLEAVLLRPLPVQRPEELAHIYTSCRAGAVYCASSYPEYLDYRAQNRSFVDLAAFDPASVNVSAASGSWVANALLVSTNYFSLLGVAPHAGQLLSEGMPGIDVAGKPSVVLGHSLWLTRFGGGASVIGQTLRLSGTPFRIVGVAPPEFRGTRLGASFRPDLWIPIDNVDLLPGGGGGGSAPVGAGDSDMLIRRDTRWIDGTVGRLRPGTTVAQAEADMRLISDSLQATDPSRAGRFITVEAASRAALPPAAAGNITRFVALLMGGVSATLLIACANVAGLLLARGAARRQELELRRALGAGRGRLVRQLLGEYLPLALAGTVCGIVVSRWAMTLLSAYNLPGALPIGSLDLDLNARVIEFAALLLCVTALFGLFPALGATRGLSGTMASRTTGEGTGTLRGQGTLLGAQVAVTIVLLFSAGLFIRSLQHGLALDLGVTSRPVVMAQISPALERYAPERIRPMLDEAVARLASQPGIETATVAVLPPLTGGNGFLLQRIEGYSPAADEEIRLEANFVGPDYFNVLGIPIRSGRALSDADREGAPLVAVISETMARRYWAGRNPVGTHFSSRSFGESVEVVGVAGNVTVGLDSTAPPFAYLPLRQHPRFLPRPLTFLIRSNSDASLSAASVRDVLRQIDSSLPVTNITTLDDRIAQLLMPQRLGSGLLSLLAGVTVILVIVGVAGTVSYGVSRRRREIGVRLALGAERLEVTGAMMRGTLVPVAAGFVVGMAAAFSLGRLLSSFLYGIEPTDILTFMGAIAVLAAATGVASFVPAWRAAGINPAEVLNAE